MEPFQITFGFNLPDLTLSTGDEFTVPKGKRLVIELIAGQGSVEAEQILEAGMVLLQKILGNEHELCNRCKTDMRWRSTAFVACFSQ
jgi:hypothetical protein